MIILAFISSILATIWPVRLGELYTDISGGGIVGMKQGGAAVITFGVIYFTAECITIVRRVLLDCIIADHESEMSLVLITIWGMHVKKKKMTEVSGVLR